MRPIAKPESAHLDTRLSATDRLKLLDEEFSNLDLSPNSSSVWFDPQKDTGDARFGRKCVNAYIETRKLSWPRNMDLYAEESEKISKEAVARWCANNGLFENFMRVALECRVETLTVDTTLGAETACRALSRCSGLRTLRIHYAAVSEAALISLIENDTLEFLQLFDCTLTPSVEEIAAIQRTCGPQKRLEFLSCVAKGVGRAAFDPLVNILSCCPALTRLWVEVGHDAASVRSLITVLEQHRSVQDLHVEVQSMAAAEALLAALASDQSPLKLVNLKVVNCDSSAIDKKRNVVDWGAYERTVVASATAVKLASDLIRRDGGLQRLEFAHIEFRGVAIADLLSAWRQNRSLLTLKASFWSPESIYSRGGSPEHEEYEKQKILAKRLEQRNRAFHRAKLGIANAVVASFSMNLNKDVAALIARDLIGNHTPAELKAAHGVMAVNRASAASVERALPAPLRMDRVRW